MSPTRILTFTALICLLFLSSTSHSIRTPVWYDNDLVYRNAEWYDDDDLSPNRFVSAEWYDDDLAPMCTVANMKADITSACLTAQLNAINAYMARMAQSAENDERVVFGRDLIKRWQESADDMCEMMANELNVWDESFWLEQFNFLLDEMNKPEEPAPGQNDPVTIIKKSVVTTKQHKFSLKVCSSTGDPHITALDKTVNHFTEPGTGLTLFRYRDFVLYADTFGKGLTGAVTVKTEGHKLVFTAGKTVLFDGRTIRVSTIPTPLPNGITVKLTGTKYIVATPAGATVEIAKVGESYFNVYVSVPSDWIPTAYGRCIHKDHTFLTVQKETCVQKCDDDLMASDDSDKHSQCTALCDDDYSAAAANGQDRAPEENDVDKLMAQPWKDEQLRERAEHVCGKVLKLEQPYLDFCLADVKLTNDIDAAQSFLDVKSSLKLLSDIDNREENGTRDGTRAAIFGLLAQQLDSLKNTQDEITRLMGKLPEGSKLKDRVSKFLVENSKDIEEVRNVQQEITSEILDEGRDD